jgi:hypothetical protein
MAWNECIKTKRYIKINYVCLEGPTNAGKSLLIDTLISVCKPDEIPRERDNSSFHLDQLPGAAAALFDEPLITPVNVGTRKLLLEGKTIKTDIKHRDKEGIARLPVWITTATPITEHVDNNETGQIMQRVTISLYKYRCRCEYCWVEFTPCRHVVEVMWSTFHPRQQQMRTLHQTTTMTTSTI